MIGFDRKIQLDWLDLTAAKAAEAASAEELRDFLLSRLDTLSYDGTHGSARAKTVRVLMRIWGDVDPEIRELHDSSLDMLPALPADRRLALHWTMMIAAYSFFTDIASIFGRLLELQQSVSAAQLRRRLREKWGDRSTIERTSRHVARSMVEWGVLEEVGQGTYQEGRILQVGNGLALRLLEAVLLDAERDSLTFDEGIKHPALFPFRVNIDARDIRHDGRLSMYRQGLDVEMVTVRSG